MAFSSLNTYSTSQLSRKEPIETPENQYQTPYNQLSNPPCPVESRILKKRT
jgi:hypothetical protein